MTAVESDALITGAPAAVRRRCVTSPASSGGIRRLDHRRAAGGCPHARLIVGGWAWTDALVAGVIVAAFPFYEWVIHVFLLHWAPQAGRPA